MQFIARLNDDGSPYTFTHFESNEERDYVEGLFTQIANLEGQVASRDNRIVDLWTQVSNLQAEAQAAAPAPKKRAAPADAPADAP